MTHYSDAERQRLIKRAIAKYEGETGGTKDQQKTWAPVATLSLTGGAAAARPAGLHRATRRLWCRTDRVMIGAQSSGLKLASRSGMRRIRRISAWHAAVRRPLVAGTAAHATAVVQRQ